MTTQPCFWICWDFSLTLYLRIMNYRACALSRLSRSLCISEPFNTFSSFLFSSFPTSCPLGVLCLPWPMLPSEPHPRTQSPWRSPSSSYSLFLPVLDSEHRSQVCVGADSNMLWCIGFPEEISTSMPELHINYTASLAGAIHKYWLYDWVLPVWFTFITSSSGRSFTPWLAVFITNRKS